MGDEQAGPSAAGNNGRTAPPWWTIVFPASGVLAVLVSPAGKGGAETAAATVVLVGAVLAALHHAEVAAHRAGEPFGALVLAVAVTVIEVSLIVSLMLSNAGDARRWRATRCSRRS